FVTVLDHKQVNPGDKVTLSCEVNTTTVNVTWKKNGEKLTCLEGKYQINLQGKKCSLEIQNVQEADEGNYTVEVTNRLGTVSCSCTVTVVIKHVCSFVYFCGSSEEMETLRHFEISNEVSELRFLLHGPIGAGKSSIINTIKSVFERRLFFNSLVGEAGDSFTLTMQECGHRLGVPVNCIFLVKNYHEEIRLDENINCLILDALTHIVYGANDYVERYTEKKNCVE
ncbi:hypothetical protein NFI96_027367, partial [Prochilodus magdalenae]